MQTTEVEVNHAIIMIVIEKKNTAAIIETEVKINNYCKIIKSLIIFIVINKFKI